VDVSGCAYDVIVARRCVTARVDKSEYHLIVGMPVNKQFDYQR
jgi:hypothetical protein